MSVTNIAKELRERGFIEHEGGGKMDEFLAEKRTAYLGMDPTADSLHVGNLVPILLMKRLADAGHDVHFLIGGGTGMIGDPRESGERVLLDEETLAHNTKAIHAQLLSIFGKEKYGMLNNADWLSKLGVIEFLRDIGKHFTVNQLVKRDLIKKRLESEDPISFTEFSYSLLQGYDFLHLYKEHGVDLQVGGSDQWANVISGVDLIRRKEQGDAYALTVPIIMDIKSGKKFGKSEGNAVWLDPKKTSPFAFYQFWLNVSDEGLETYFKIFTDLSLEEIVSLLAEHVENPQNRVGQKRLAHEVTTLIHGVEASELAAKQSGFFYRSPTLLKGLSKEDFEILINGLPSTESDGKISDSLVQTGVAHSKSEARRLMVGGAVSSVFGTVISDENSTIAQQESVNDTVLLRVGKNIVVIKKPK